jgi:peptidyl-prolyl cis-trans isomerase SurA
MEKIVRKWQLINIFVFFLIFLFSPLLGKTAELADRIVAIVDNDIITLYDLNNALKPYEKNIKYNTDYADTDKSKMLYGIREKILAKLVEEKLIERKAKELKISVSEKVVDATIERFKKLNYLTDKDLRSSLKKRGVTMEEYRSEIKKKLLGNRLVNYEIKSKIVVTKEAVKTYYEENIKKYGEQKRYFISNILLKNKELSENILKKIEKGESFKNMAKEYSVSYDSENGASLGSIFLNSIAPDIKNAIENLNSGEISRVVETPNGFQIFYINNIEVLPVKTLDKVYSEIEKELYSNLLQEKFNIWMDKLKEQSYIKIVN